MSRIKSVINYLPRSQGVHITYFTTGLIWLRLIYKIGLHCIVGVLHFHSARLYYVHTIDKLILLNLFWLQSIYLMFQHDGEQTF